MNIKEIAYDWGGANIWLFKHINAYRIESLDPVLVLLTKTGDHKNFPYYFAAIAVLGLLAMVARKIRGRHVDRQYVKSWAGLLIVLVTGYVATAGSIGLLKKFFQFPRPFIVLGSEAHVVGALPEAGVYYASLPSGHAAFMAFLITAVWPKLHEHGTTLGVFFILLAGYARIATGMHFPADVLYAILLGSIITMVVRRFIYRLFSIPYY